MKGHDQKEFDARNREIIAQFLYDAQKHGDDLSGSVIATMTQFIMNLRINIGNKGRTRQWVTPEEIINAQVEELRRCIIDLEAYKNRLTKGETKQ